MNPEQWIKEVKVVLDKKRPVDVGHNVLVVDEGHLALKTRFALKNTDKTIAILAQKDVNEGLTSKRWYSIGCKLAAQKSLNPELV